MVHSIGDMERKKRVKLSRARVRHVQWRCLSLEASLFPADLGVFTLRATLLTRLWLPQVELAILAGAELCSRQGPLACMAREWLCGCLSGSLFVQLHVSTGPSFGTVGATLLTRLWLPQVELAILAGAELCSRHGPLAYLAREWLCGCLSGPLLVQLLVSTGPSFGTCR